MSKMVSLIERYIPRVLWTNREGVCISVLEEGERWGWALWKSQGEFTVSGYIFIMDSLPGEIMLLIVWHV